MWMLHLLLLLLLLLLHMANASWIVKPPTLQIEWKQMISLIVETWDAPPPNDNRVSWWERISWELWNKNQVESKMYRRYVHVGRKLMGSKYAVLVAKSTNNEMADPPRVLGMAELGIHVNTPDGKPQATLGILCVDKGYRKLGIGRALVEECLRIVQSSWKEPCLYVEVQRANIGAIALFQSCGFRQVTENEVMVRIRQRQRQRQRRGEHWIEQPHLLLTYNFTETISSTPNSSSTSIVLR
jgi:ribosomal protein S18 acetylase RimI-like enzyme